jgi:Rrf2 family transcriptional regulator, nitric oxide-sensitive transcriptional repressor
MLTQTVEYALRAVAQLGYVAPDLMKTSDLAERTKVPMPYLRKVLQKLREAGIVALTRGVHGGARLLKTPAQLTLLEVVNAVEPVQRIKTCPLGLKTHGIRLCPLHRKIDNALAEMEVAFHTTTLADILNEPTDRPPLCESRKRMAQA